MGCRAQRSTKHFSQKSYTLWALFGFRVELTGLSEPLLMPDPDDEHDDDRTMTMVLKVYDGDGGDDAVVHDDDDDEQDGDVHDLIKTISLIIFTRCSNIY